jgi:hypothetical protein
MNESLRMILRSQAIFRGYYGLADDTTHHLPGRNKENLSGWLYQRFELC